MSILIFVTLFSFLLADPFSFTLVYTGDCAANVQNCRMKAASQIIATSITPQGAVSETITKRIGALSMGFFSMTSTTSFVGNVTFGIHSTHEDHTLDFKGTCSAPVSEDQGELSCFSGMAIINAGEGAWEGASGTIGISGCLNITVPAFTTIEATVTARVFVPSSTRAKSH